MFPGCIHLDEIKSCYIFGSEFIPLPARSRQTVFGDFRPLVNTVHLLGVPAIPHASSWPHTQARLFCARVFTNRT